jgi:recombination protein RecT
MSTDLAPAKTSVPALSKNLQANKIQEYFDSSKMRARIAQALPKHMTADRMIRMVFTSMTKTPKLLQCSLDSLVLSVLSASQIGVELNGRDAYLVPFKGQCQLIVSYMGMIQLAYNSGVVKSISARAVHANDTFSYTEGSDEKLIYHPYEGDGEPGSLTHAWAMVKFHNGGEKFVVLNRREVMERKKSSKNPQNWDLYPDQYWAKSAIRKLSNYMPQTAELRRFHDALNLDTEQDCGPARFDLDEMTSMPSRSAELANELSQPPVNVTSSPAESEKESPPDREPGDEPADEEEEATEVARVIDELRCVEKLEDLARMAKRIPPEWSVDHRSKVVNAIEMRKAEIQGRSGASSKAKNGLFDGVKGGKQ